jgi:hypothetical protein
MPSGRKISPAPIPHQTSLIVASELHTLFGRSLPDKFSWSLDVLKNQNW